MTKRLEKFLSLAQEVVNANHAERFPSLEVPRLRFDGGKRYIRIIEESTYNDCVSARIFCFIDSTNGDILKPSSYRKPAKHARGNIFDEDYGMRNVGPYGIAYMDSKQNILTPLGK